MKKQVLLAAAIISALALELGTTELRSNQRLLEAIHEEPCREGRPMSHWIRELGNPLNQARHDAITNLGDIGEPAACSIPALTHIAHNDHISLRSWAINYGMGHMGSTAVPIVRSFLHEPALRTVAVVTLGEMGPMAAVAVPDLLPLLDDRTSWTQLQVCRALGGIGPGAKEALPALVARWRRADPEFRQIIMEAIRRIEPDRSQVIGLPANEAMFEARP